jgi:hypothetical protein
VIKSFLLVFMLAGFVLSLISIGNANAEIVNSDVNQRLNSYVSKYGIVLDEKSNNDVLQKCTTIQNQVTILQANSSIAVTKRLNTYSNLQKEIRAIELRMMRQGVDASELDLFIGKIQQGQDSLTLAADNFGTAADDIRLIDCQKRPEQFKAGLIELKSLHKQLVETSKELRLLIEKSPNTTFGPLKDRLSL